MLIASPSRWQVAGARTGQRYSDTAALVAEGNLGYAFLEVLTTPSGQVWVGYSDEAIVGKGPESHGLVLFNDMLQPVWVYPYPPNTNLPPVYDVRCLNVDDETASICSRRDFHLVRATKAGASDLGKAPVNRASALLIDEGRAVIVGGHQAEYDIVTPVLLTRDGPRAAGRQGRVVMPDGLEVRGNQWHCRGGQAYTVIHMARYRLDLQRVFDILT